MLIKVDAYQSKIEKGKDAYKVLPLLAIRDMCLSYLFLNMFTFLLIITCSGILFHLDEENLFRLGVRCLGFCSFRV